LQTLVSGKFTKDQVLRRVSLVLLYQQVVGGSDGVVPIAANLSTDVLILDV
jgi:hypothetical protein